MMNVFRRKRKREDDDDSEEPKTKIDLLAWFKEKFNRMLKRDSRKNILSKKYGETPPQLKVERYILSPPQQVPINEIRHNLDYYVRDDIISTTENKFYEFKAAGGRYFKDILPEHIRKYGSGFLNSQGGMILAGILDNGLIRGVYLRAFDKHMIKRTVGLEFSKFRPKVDKSLYSVEFRNVVKRSEDPYMYNMCFPLQDIYIVEIRINKGQEGEIYEDANHKVFVRREASVEGPLPPLKIKELVLEEYKKIIALAEIERLKRKRKYDLLDDVEESTNKQKKRNITPIVFHL